MSRRVEMNPGEVFMVADRTILVHERESVLGDVAKIGSSEHRLAYFLTFSGKVNNRDEQDDVTVALSPEDAFALASDILDGLHLLTGDADHPDGSGAGGASVGEGGK